MSNDNQHEKKIIEALNNMPKIKDETPKNRLYQRASSNLSNSRTKKKKAPIFSPVIGTILALALFILIPFMVNNTSNEAIEDNSMDQFEASTVEDNKMIPESFTQSEDDASDSSDVAEQEIMMKQEEFNHFVIQTVDGESDLIYGAIPDEQFQYVIPITFVVSENKNLNAHYNNLEQYLREAALLQGDYLLEDITFTIDNETNEVDIKLPNTYSIESSAEAYMFVEMLEAMFVPLGIEKAVFASDTGEAANLGPIGTVEELPLQDGGKATYKLYNNQFLVPIPLEEQATIEETILNMKIHQEDFNISQTIPERVDFSIDSTESELILSYTGEELLVDNGQMVTMIEAILMTAKSFGFETVKFIDMNIPSIGNYNLTEGIHVPDAVNPIARE